MPWSGCALFLLQTRTARRCAAASRRASTRRGCIEHDPVKSGAGPDRLGRAQPPARSSTRSPRADFEAAGHRRRPTTLQSALVCPLVLQRHASSARLARLPHRRRTATPTTTAGCSSASPSRPAPVIHNSIVFEQTQEDSLTDPLTGLPNRGSCSCTSRASWRAPSA